MWRVTWALLYDMYCKYLQYEMFFIILSIIGLSNIDNRERIFIYIGKKSISLLNVFISLTLVWVSFLFYLADLQGMMRCGEVDIWHLE